MSAKISEKIAKRALDVVKEWVRDPSEQAEQTRWRNTQTGEYRYQENKPEDEGRSAPQEGGADISEYETGDFEVDSEYEAAVAESVTEGWFGNTHHQENFVAVRNFQHNASQIDNPNILAEALEQEIEGRNSRTMRDAIEKRLRALDAEDRIPDHGDENVPEIRQGTSVDGFESEDVVNAAGYVIRHWRAKDTNFEEWNVLLDHMTQEELLDAVKEWDNKKLDEATYDPTEAADMMEWEDGAVHGDTRGFSQSPTPAGLGPLVSRMDRETMREMYEWSKNEAESNNTYRYAKALAYYGQDKIAREEIAKEAAMKEEHREALYPEGDFDTWTDAMASEWSWHTNEIVNHLRMATQNYGPNLHGDQTVYARDRPMSDIEPSDGLLNGLQELHQRSQDFHEKEDLKNIIFEHRDQPDVDPQDAINEDGTITVYRGDGEITSHGTLESWSLSKSKAEDFGKVMEAKVEPEDILMSKFMAEEDAIDAPFVGFEDEEELVVFGGAFE